MPISDKFPNSPFEELNPEVRWIPDSDNKESFKLIPPLVLEVYDHQLFFHISIIE